MACFWKKNKRNRALLGGVSSTDTLYVPDLIKKSKFKIYSVFP
jgi:hypothetical protein